MLNPDELKWLLELVNEFDAVSHPHALSVYVKLKAQLDGQPVVGGAQLCASPHPQPEGSTT